MGRASATGVSGQPQVQKEKTMGMRATTLMLSLALSLAAPLAGAAPAPFFPDPTAGISLDAPRDFVDARQYKITNAQLAAPLSGRQSVTAWQVTHGSWNGQSLDGLSLVLVQTLTNEGQPALATHCYVSHLATPAQRSALLNAFAASLPQGDPLRARTPDSWRVEPAVIKLEFAGQTVILHLGAIA